MTTLKKAPIHLKSKIEFLYACDIASEKPQQGETIVLGPILLSTAHVN